MENPTVKEPTILIASSQSGIDIAMALQGFLGAHAQVNVWSEAIAFSPGIEPLLNNLDRIDFAIFIVAKDDLIRTHSSSSRDNFLFELGLLQGRIGRARTFILTVGDVDLPTSILGTLAIRIDDNDKRYEFYEALRVTADSIVRTIENIAPPSPPPTNFYSCFISYHSSDEEFVKQIYSDLRDLGIRCWFAPQDLKIGKKIRPQIEEAIQFHDKVLVVLSDASLHSSWVEHEVNRALEIERIRNRTVLFPIRMDNAVMNSPNPVFGKLLHKYIGDFTKWKDEEAYKKAFSRLVKDLTISVALETDMPYHA